MKEQSLYILMECINSDDGIYVYDCFKRAVNVLQERYQDAIDEGLIEWSGHYLVATDKGHMLHQFFRRPMRHLSKAINEERAFQNQKLQKADNQNEASVIEGRIYGATSALTLMNRHKDDYSTFNL
jgi:ligand-binding sensor domain-containing protein